MSNKSKQITRDVVEMSIFQVTPFGAASYRYIYFYISLNYLFAYYSYNRGIFVQLLIFFINYYNCLTKKCIIEILDNNQFALARTGLEFLKLALLPWVKAKWLPSELSCHVECRQSLT